MKKYLIHYKMDELPRRATIEARNSKDAIDKASEILARKYGTYPLSISAEEMKERSK